MLWFVRKTKWWVERILFMSTWAFELCEAIFVAFVTLGGERLGVALELPRLWWAMGKFVNVRFASERKEARATEVRKAVERDPAWC
jgi:hypothetical protein